MIALYPLEWFDTLILQTLNPAAPNIGILSDNELSLISENVLKESQKIQVQLKSEVFTLHKKSQIRLLVRKYHSTLIFLLDTIIERQKCEEFQIKRFSKVIEMIIEVLEDLLCFVESRFSYYLSLDQSAPATHMMICTKELHVNLDKVKKREFCNDADRTSMKIVSKKLEECFELNLRSKITYRQIVYHREILKDLEIVNSSDGLPDIFSCLDKLLIRVNFNAVDYISSLISRLENKLSCLESPSYKISAIELYYKEFNQLYSNEKVTFDESQQNIKHILDNWFIHEIAYQKSQTEPSSTMRISSFDKTQCKAEIAQNKIECALSCDQIALILRAGDESRILKARSMSQVFKTIVPYLSTSLKKDLSYDSVRSKSYCAEERDKEIAIKTLERIIKHIKEY